MPFKLISEEDMASKSKSKSKKEIKIVTEPKKIDTEIKIEPTEPKKIDTEIKIEPTEPKKIDTEIKIYKGDTGTVNSVIVKKIYFPTDLYSKNQKEFKNILANYDLAWFKPMYKMYVSKKGVKLASGAYISSDKNKMVLCVYEGSKMPMTAIVKIVGTGGNFLVEMNSFCSRIGCIIEDKDELYYHKVTSTFKERQELYVEGMEETIAEKLKKGDISLDEKIKSMVDESLQRYVDAYKDSLERKSVSIETFKFFKRKELEKDIKWAIENGLINLEEKN